MFLSSSPWLLESEIESGDTKENPTESCYAQFSHRICCYFSLAECSALAARIAVVLDCQEAPYCKESPSLISVSDKQAFIKVHSFTWLCLLSLQLAWFNLCFFAANCNCKQQVMAQILRPSWNQTKFEDLWLMHYIVPGYFTVTRKKKLHPQIIIFLK